MTDFVEEVNADRSAMDSYASRVDGLSAPGDMGKAQSALELVYDLRSGAMDEIADEMSTALGDVGAEKATAVIANQMQKFLASDVLYASVVRPEIDRVLADNGIEGDDVPESVFLPEGTKWLEEKRDQLGAGAGQRRGPRRNGRHPRARAARHEHRRDRAGRRTRASPWRPKKRPKSKSKSRTRGNRPRAG